MIFKFIGYYLLAFTVLGIVTMGVDKLLAKQEASFRIPEKILFAIAFLGGCLGSWAGMYMFRHKTQHWYFVWGMPFIFLFHLALIFAYFIFIN